MAGLAIGHGASRTGARPGPVAVPATGRGAPAPNARLADREDLTPTVARFEVETDEAIERFEPGQYFALGLTVDGRPLLRPYSTASLPGTGRRVEFLIRLVAGGALTPRLWELRVGDRLWIGRPKGLFRLRAGDPRTHLFVATGTGLAPLVSMAESLARAGRAGPSVAAARAVVVHGVSYADELAYRDRLERLAASTDRVRYVPVVSRPGEAANVSWAGLTGRIDARLAEVCEAHGLDPTGTVAYLCGNPEMIASAERVLAGRGFAGDAIVTEHYWPLA